jgi:hypothetical protein
MYGTLILLDDPFFDIISGESYICMLGDQLILQCAIHHWIDNNLRQRWIYQTEPVEWAPRLP